MSDPVSQGYGYESDQSHRPYTIVRTVQQCCTACHTDARWSSRQSL